VAGFDKDRYQRPFEFVRPTSFVERDGGVWLYVAKEQLEIANEL